MNYLKKAGFLAGIFVLGTTAVMAARIDRASISITRVEVVSAAQDGTAWALTTDGKILHCRFESEGDRVRCFDRNGPTGPDY